MRNQMRDFLYQEELNRFQVLQRWTKEFFQNNSIERVLWWNKYEEPNDLENAFLQQKIYRNVDLILQVQNLECENIN